MEWYFIFLIIVIVLLFVFLFPLFLQVRFYFNALQNLGAISITLLWFIPVFCVQFEISKDAINIITKKKQDKVIDIFSPSAIFFMIFIQQVLKKIYLLEFSLFCLVGKKDNAMATAMLNGFLINIIHILLAIIHTKKGDFISHLVCNVDYQESALKFSGYCSTFIFPITILWCLIKTGYAGLNKEIKYAKR